MHITHPTVQPFAIVRKGFDRDQVMAALARLEAEAELLRADRDAAVDRADRASAELERERDRVRALESRVAELGRVPATSEQMSDRLATMLRLATDEAESIRDSAHATADRILTEAEEQAWALRESAAAELSGIRERNAEIRRVHDAILRSAHDRAAEILLSARREAERLDAEAADRRDRIDEDHRLASDLRRRESMEEERRRQRETDAEITRRLEDARTRAEEILTEARDEAATIIDTAAAYTRTLRELRTSVLSELAGIRARLEPIPAREADDEPLPTPPEFNSSDG